MTQQAKLYTDYDISKTADWINGNDYKRVALQFSDDLLTHSAAITACLGHETNAELFILADTSYGSCCVDEVAAQHYNSNALIHYGHSCLSETSRIPVLYVFGKHSLDVTDCCKSFQDMFPILDVNVLILYDVIYEHAIAKVYELLLEKYPNVVLSRLRTSDIPESECKGEILKCGRIIHIDKTNTIDKYSMFYVGAESLSLTNLMMTFNRCRFHSYDPVTKCGRQETLNVNRMLMKRYNMIEKARDANIVGIVAGTLGVKDYMSVIARLKKLVKNAGKKSYTIVMGKLNPAKLANLMEIDIFVLVACSENSLIDSAEFYKPIVTPYEMEIACNSSRDWTGDYVTDFRELLPGAASYIEITDSYKMISEVSLVTGQLRTLGRDTTSDTHDATSNAVVERDTMVVKEHTAGEYLSGRSWRGLEQQLGETPVLKAAVGSKGIASGYDGEGT